MAQDIGRKKRSAHELGINLGQRNKSRAEGAGRPAVDVGGGGAKIGRDRDFAPGRD
jgi:hypothetical protein